MHQDSTNFGLDILPIMDNIFICLHWEFRSCLNDWILKTFSNKEWFTMIES